MVTDSAGVSPKFTRLLQPPNRRGTQRSGQSWDEGFVLCFRHPSKSRENMWWQWKLDVYHEEMPFTRCFHAGATRALLLFTSNQWKKKTWTYYGHSWSRYQACGMIISNGMTNSWPEVACSIRSLAMLGIPAIFRKTLPNHFSSRTTTITSTLVVFVHLATKTGTFESVVTVMYWTYCSLYSCVCPCTARFQFSVHPEVDNWSLCQKMCSYFLTVPICSNYQS